MNDIECPYCEGINEVNHDDGEKYDEDKTHEMECDHCRKNFVFHTAISFDYSPKKADCLNGSPHKFTDWFTLWLDEKNKEIQCRICKDCDRKERRTLPTQTQPQ
jgi:hypothetical protein